MLPRPFCTPKINCEYHGTGTVQEICAPTPRNPSEPSKRPCTSGVVGEIPGVRMGRIDPAEGGEKLPAFDLQIPTADRSFAGTLPRLRPRFLLLSSLKTMLANPLEVGIQPAVVPPVGAPEDGRDVLEAGAARTPPMRDRRAAAHGPAPAVRRDRRGRAPALRSRAPSRSSRTRAGASPPSSTPRGSARGRPRDGQLPSDQEPVERGHSRLQAARSARPRSPCSPTAHAHVHKRRRGAVEQAGCPQSVEIGDAPVF